MTTTTAAPRGRITTRNRVGLGLAALLGVLDLISLAVPQPAQEDPDAAGPPLAILVVGALLGVITLVAVVHAWRTGSRVSARIIAGTRILSLLGALPAFFVPGVPAWVVAVVAATAVLTVVSILLVLSRSPEPTPAAG